jgi:hypothetical protein
MRTNAQSNEPSAANLSHSARLATLPELKKTTLEVFINPIPSDETLRAWFDDAKIPRFKQNPFAKRGGGPVYYSVAAVEKFFRSRTLPVSCSQ